MPACSRGASAGRDGAGAQAGRGAAGERGAAQRVFRVATAPVALQDVTYTIRAVGSIEAESEVQAVAGVEGVVTSVRFREGDAVTPSTILATIDPERYRVQAERARASYERFRSQHQQALADLKRREELSLQTPPLISQEEVERARQEAEQLRASMAEAQAQFDLAEQDRRRSVVRPLVPGVINSKTVIVGQHVDSKAVLATLVDTRHLNLRFSISEKESARLREGMAVGFTTDSRPGEAFGASLFHVSSTADPATRMVECLARVEKSAGLKPGFFAEVRADVESHKDAIVIPERAVLPTDRGFVVFEVRDGAAVRRQVELGLRTRDGGIEVLSGLERQAVVVTDGGDVLKDGVPVQDGAPDQREASRPGGAAAPAGREP
jgi:membrane fusion protein (multidrug efflux system)/multidrug efflux system membrane fusion protein